MSLRAVNWAPPTSLKEVPYVTLATNSKRKSNEIKKKEGKEKNGNATQATSSDYSSRCSEPNPV